MQRGAAAGGRDPNLTPDKARAPFDDGTARVVVDSAAATGVVGLSRSFPRRRARRGGRSRKRNSLSRTSRPRYANPGARGIVYVRRGMVLPALRVTQKYLHIREENKEKQRDERKGLFAAVAIADLIYGDGARSYNTERGLRYRDGYAVK